MAIKTVLRRTFRLLFKALLIGFALSILTVILYRFVPPPVTYLMLHRTGAQLIEGKKVKLKKNWVSADEISDNLKRAVIAAEDQQFLSHFGFDFEAIEKAYERNKRGKKVRGASTISQQCAKNVFLWPKRNWLRKGFEVYFTFLIEVFWSKERIMEVYLNVIETGDGIYGAEAASQVYFHKQAKKLTKSEAALIAAVLPNPRKWKPSNPSGYILKRQRWIMRNMDRLGPLEF